MSSKEAVSAWTVVVTLRGSDAHDNEVPSYKSVRSSCDRGGGFTINKR